MGIFEMIKNKSILKKVNKLNNNLLETFEQVDGIYRGKLPINYNDIKLPDGIISTIHLYNSGDTLQIYLMDNEKRKKKNPIAELEVLKTDKMIEEEKVKEKQKVDNYMEDEKKLKEWKRLVNARYDAYLNYLLIAGANGDILDFPAIQDLILHIIRDSNPKNIMRGHSPIVYEMPNPDGTFNIAGRMKDNNIDEFYKMSYCDDDNDEHYLKLEKNPVGNICTKVIYINKEGNIDKNTHIKTK
ncbi:MAG: hypothetical protein IJI43_03115 [Bacilli bacterium]|nr:hypothetical protein [Bacilli bacterium]